MIPRHYIAKWSDHAPWQTNDQIEQDLIISRTLVEIFSDPFLQENLAFRGGTALHKLYLSPAPRYSEDIDLVQIRPGPIKPIFKRIGEVIGFFEEIRKTKQGPGNNTILYRYTSEYSQTRQRLKIEINCREHFNVLDRVNYPYEVKNDWFTGGASITTYNISELLGSKMRALYQRKKGRDLFDIYYAAQNTELKEHDIIKCYQQYMGFSVDASPTKKQFLQNLKDKQRNENFQNDVKNLLRPGIEYDADQAFTWIKEALIEIL